MDEESPSAHVEQFCQKSQQKKCCYKKSESYDALEPFAVTIRDKRFNKDTSVKKPKTTITQKHHFRMAQTNISNVVQIDGEKRKLSWCIGENSRTYETIENGDNIAQGPGQTHAMTP